jgi:hypothetical protein
MEPRPLLTVFALHVIQYQAPLYAELALHPDLDLHVAFFSDKGPKPYFDSGFARRVQWDIDLRADYHHLRATAAGYARAAFHAIRDHS